MSLSSLPPLLDCLWPEVISYLLFQDAASLAQTCKALKDKVNADLLFQKKQRLLKDAITSNDGMISAVREGYRDLVLFFTHHGARNWNCGMAWAAIEGHKDLVDFFVDQGADNWTWGMLQAASGGHKDLVAFFKSKE